MSLPPNKEFFDLKVAIVIGVLFLDLERIRLDGTPKSIDFSVQLTTRDRELLERLEMEHQKTKEEKVDGKKSADVKLGKGSPPKVSVFLTSILHKTNCVFLLVELKGKAENRSIFKNRPYHLVWKLGSRSWSWNSSRICPSHTWLQRFLSPIRPFSHESQHGSHRRHPLQSAR